MMDNNFTDKWGKPVLHHKNRYLSRSSRQLVAVIKHHYSSLRKLFRREIRSGYLLRTAYHAAKRRRFFAAIGGFEHRCVVVYQFLYR